MAIETNIHIPGILEVTKKGIKTLDGDVLSLGKDIQSGIETFNNEKKKSVVFLISYDNKPEVQLTQEDAHVATAPVFRKNVSKTGFDIVSSVNYNGRVGWISTKKL